MLEANRRWKRV